MSKKQKENKQVTKEPKIVDQQKEPCLRALQKKVRNINKKLNDIAELEKRNDLKPEQEEKIEKKEQTLQEKEKYTEFISLYKDILADNEQAYRQWQITEVKDLANLLVAQEYGFPSNNAHLNRLVTLLAQPSTKGLTLEQRLKELTEALVEVANSTRVKSAAEKFIEENKDKVLGQEEQEEASDEQESTLPLITKQTTSEEKVRIENQATEEKKVTVIEEHHEEHKQESEIKETPAVEEPKVEAPAEEEKKVNGSAPSAPEENKEGGDKPAQEQKRNYPKRGERRERGEKYRRDYENKDRKPREPREPREGGDKTEEGQKRYTDRKDRPFNNRKRYQEKHPAPQKQNDESSSSLDSTPEPREFKREEVKNLIEDGFIVVGKPKPKAREQKQYYNHTHGNKGHGQPRKPHNN